MPSEYQRHLRKIIWGSPDGPPPWLSEQHAERKGTMNADNIDMALEMIESMDAKIEDLIKRVRTLESELHGLAGMQLKGYATPHDIKQIKQHLRREEYNPFR